MPAGTVTFVPITSDLHHVPTIRISVQPTRHNGLHKISEIMIDRIQTSTVGRVGEVVGHLDQETMEKVEVALMIFLGLA